MKIKLVQILLSTLVLGGCGCSGRDVHGQTDTGIDLSVEIDAFLDIADGPDGDLPDPSPDTFVEPEPDTLEDPRPDEEPDTVPDTGPDPDPDPAPDLVPDPILDAVSDPDPLRDILWDPYTDVPPDGMVGRCNVVDQTGCPPGAWCDWAWDMTYCYWYEECSFRAPGTLPPGASCSLSSTSRCEPGTWCWSISSGIQRCQEWCRDDLDCSIPGETCGTHPSGNWTMGSCAGVRYTFPYGLCMP